MPAYAYPIQIDENPKVISSERSINLGTDTRMTLKQLMGYGITDKDEFEIIEDNNEHTLYIFKAN